MSRFLFIILILLLSFVSCSSSSKDNSPYPSEAGEEVHDIAGEEVHDILGKASKAIKKKYGLRPFGTGAAMPGGVVKVLILAFETRDQLSREELRGLLVNSAQELITQAQINGKIEQFLEKPPFEMKNVEIVIFNRDKNGRDLCDPEISTARINGDNLIYKTNDPEDEFRYKNRYEETYEEALAILQSQGRI